MKGATVQSLNIPRNALSEDRVGFCIATRSVKKLSPNNKRQKTSDTLRYLYSRAFITPVLTTSASVTSQLRRLSVKSIKLQIKSALGLLACNALQSPQASAGGGGCSGQRRTRAGAAADPRAQRLEAGGRAAAAAAAPRVGAGSGGAGPGSATRSAAAAAAAAERVPLAHARCPGRAAP